MKDFFNIESPFMQLLTRLGDMIIVNFLFLVCCTPLITVGASAAALHKVTQAMVLDEDNGIVKTFFRAFRDNFKQATGVWLLILIFAAASVCNYLLILGFVDGMAATLLKGILVLAVVLVLVMAAYLFPLMVRYTNTVRQHAVNALILAIVKLPRTVGLVLLCGMPILILVLSLETFASTLVFWLTLGFAFTSYMSSVLLKPVFKELEDADGPGVQIMK